MFSRMRWLTCIVLLSLVSTALGKSGKAEVSAVLDKSALPANADATLGVIIDIPSGLHGQSHTPTPGNLALEIKVTRSPGIDVSSAIYPQGKDETYPILGTLNVYVGKAVIYIPLHVKSDAPLGDVKIVGTVQYQLCDDKQCFLPVDAPFAVTTKIIPAGTAVQANAADVFAGFRVASSTTAPAPTQASGGRVVTQGQNWSLPFAFGLAFIAGLIFNVMPCVLPVLPLKAMGFYEVSQHNRAKSLALGLIFSLGIVASFAVLGLLVIALQVFKWGELFSNPWFLSALVIVLVVMALSMFGFFTVNLPTSVYRFTPRHDTYTGNFLFGILTAALSTPCTFGMFFGLLAWALAQPVAIGVSLMVVVGIGMAFPYFVLSAFPEVARRFPRTGPWAETIKQLMGFLLLGTAAYFAGPFINRVLGENGFWWVIFAVVVAAAFFLVYRTFKFSKTLLPRAIATAIALAMILPSLYVVRLLTVKPYEWQPYSEQALTSARNSGRIALVEFTADWCGNCHALEAFVLNSRRVVKTVDDNRVVMLKADVTAEGSPARPFLNQLTPVGAIPLTAIYSPNAKDPIQLSGIYSPTELIDAISRAAK